ncbi:MAG: conjugal transfer protein TraG N-terminal domain-containing protein, partial [Geminicoccaceae bacterium]
MDIYSIGDGRFLEQVIQAVTLVSGSGDFATMGKIGILLGVLLITFQALSSGGRNFNFTQIGVAGLAYALMFGSTQTVTVTDAYTQEVRVVDNVPTGVAAMGSFLTSIGFNLTELFETGFSTPTMTTQGYAFSLDTLKRVRMNSLTEFHLGNANAGSPNTNFVDSWSEYIKTCALPAMELGFITKDDLFRTTDFLSELGVEDPNRATLLRVTPAPQTLPCNEAFEALEIYTDNIFLPTFKGSVLPGVLDLEQPAGAAEVEQTINDALNGLGVGPAPQSNFTANAPPVSADDFITTSVLVPIYYKAVRERYVQDGNFSYADQIDDSVRARNSQWMANQSLFDRYLRPMMTFIEGFVFAATPILSLLIPIGAIGIGAAGRFLLVGAWIQLWMPAIAVVNLFLHDVVAGKMAALADAGTPLTSLAGLHQGDDVIQTWLATGGLMASAVPVLTLMIVYGGAISANFFATRLQGEDVVMERQAAGATFNPYPQMQVDPASTFNRTAGVSLQTGAEGRLDTFSYSSRAGAMFESASDARMQAVDQFGSDFRQSVSNAWSDQTTASVMQGYSERLVAENGEVESAVKQHFGDIVSQIQTEAGVSESDAINWVARGGLGLGFTAFGTGVSGSTTLDNTETSAESVKQSESWRKDIGDRVNDSEEVRASLMEAVAADIQGNTQDAMISSETLGRDETLSASAQDVVSASQSYSESISAGASMEASRSVSAATMIPAIAANREAAAE